MLTLRVVKAKFGECLILIFGDQKKPNYMLIDGGPSGVYSHELRYELTKIKNRGGCINLMVLSHIDRDHIVGLIDLTEEIKTQQADKTEPLILIKSLWMNTFSNAMGQGIRVTQTIKSLLAKVVKTQDTVSEVEFSLQSFNQAETLSRNAMMLDIPINEIVDGQTITYDTVPQWIFMGTIRIKIIGPNQENLDALQKEWEEWLLKNELNILMADGDILEDLDKSVPNLSSIMFLIESAGHTILFTGDGRGDFILEGLKKSDLLDCNGQIHLDIFKVPHHGSIRNIDADFFLQVIAKKYVISGDGLYGNPDFKTLQLIVEAAKAQTRNIEIICTYETDSTKRLITEYPQDNYGYKLIYLKKTAHSLDIIL